MAIVSLLRLVDSSKEHRWYHLSEGREGWKLRRLPNPNSNECVKEGTIQDGFLPPEGLSISVRLSIRDVSDLTGFQNPGISPEASETWQSIVDSLERHFPDGGQANDPIGPEAPNHPGRPIRRIGALARKGSKYWIQRFVNEKPEALARMIVGQSVSLASFSSQVVEWKSPLAVDGYREYRDDFLELLGLEHHQQSLREFWPLRGPQWDALGVVRDMDGERGIVLIEAKAYPREAYCSGTDATGISYQRISTSLNITKDYIGVPLETDWLGSLYQVANRLAFLHFLQITCKVPTWLVLVNFANDTTHHPTSMAQWVTHCPALWRQMGFGHNCRLLDRIITVFPDVSRWPTL